MAKTAARVYVFGKVAPTLEGRGPFQEVLIPPVLGPKDHCFLVAGPDFHLVLVGTAGVPDGERDAVFQGAWSVQPEIVQRISGALFVNKQDPLIITSNDDDALLTKCALRLMRAHAEELAERIPGARLEVLAGAAHGLMVEAPNAFNDAVLRFLTEVDAAAEGSAEQARGA